MDLSDLAASDPLDPRAIARHLDSLTHEDRVRQTRSLKRDLFSRLFAAVEGTARVSVDDLVPAGSPPLTVIRHEGTNNLPLFRAFAKPMYRDRAGRVCGRNDQAWEGLTGPGYFCVRAHGDREVLFDYTQLPDEKPEGWPAIKSNARGFSTFVFREMIDVVRRLSRDVVIGRAQRGGKELPQYFVLVRRP
jgi:hypothetical protein